MKDIMSKIARNNRRRTNWKEDREKSEEILRKRQERYASDEKYREAVKERARLRRKNTPKSDRKRSFNKDRVIYVDGSPVVLWSVGKAAAAIGVSKSTLASWERKSIIPINRMVDDIGRRWYPQEFVMFMAEAVNERENKKGRLDAWSRRVKSKWKSMQEN